MPEQQQHTKEQCRDRKQFRQEQSATRQSRHLGCARVNALRSRATQPTTPQRSKQGVERGSLQQGGIGLRQRRTRLMPNQGLLQILEICALDWHGKGLLTLDRIAGQRREQQTLTVIQPIQGHFQQGIQQLRRRISTHQQGLERLRQSRLGQQCFLLLLQRQRRCHGVTAEAVSKAQHPHAHRQNQGDQGQQSFGRQPATSRRGRQQIQSEMNRFSPPNTMAPPRPHNRCLSVSSWCATA